MRGDKREGRRTVLVMDLEDAVFVDTDAAHAGAFEESVDVKTGVLRGVVVWLVWGYGP